MICKVSHGVMVVKLSWFSFLVADTEECVAFVLRRQIARTGIVVRHAAEAVVSWKDFCIQLGTYVRS